MTVDVVIGAGIGGLSAAIRLAAAGRSVTVLEAAATPGGKAGTATVDGVTFDTGPSLLTLADVFDDLLRVAGTSLAAELTLRPHAPSFRYVWPDGTVLDTFVEPERTLASVRDTLGPADAADLAAFLAYAARIWDASADAFVLQDAPSIGSLFKLGPRALAGLTVIDAHRSMWDAIRSRVRSPYLRAVLARYATYNGSDPRRAPATLNCIAHVELGLGGFGVEGGIRALIDALVRVAGRLGVTVRCGARVERVLVERGRATGVIVDGERIAASTVVCNADVAHLHRDLLPAGPTEEVEPSMSGYNAVLRARRADRAAHTVYMPTDYLAEFADVFDRGRPPVNPTVYACAQGPAHGNPGWADHEAVFLMVNAPPEPPGGSDPATWDAVRAAALERYPHAPGDAVVWERTPTDLARRFPRSRGALYGASSNAMLAAFRRPSNRSSDVVGLYLAGGSAHPGGGMPLCALSGAAAARALLDDARARRVA